MSRHGLDADLATHSESHLLNLFNRPADNHHDGALAHLENELAAVASVPAVSRGTATPARSRATSVRKIAEEESKLVSWIQGVYADQRESDGSRDRVGELVPEVKWDASAVEGIKADLRELAKLVETETLYSSYYPDTTSARDYIPASELYIEAESIRLAEINGTRPPPLQPVHHNGTSARIALTDDERTYLAQGGLDFVQTHAMLASEVEVDGLDDMVRVMASDQWMESEVMAAHDFAIEHTYMTSADLEDHYDSDRGSWDDEGMVTSADFEDRIEAADSGSWDDDGVITSAGWWDLIGLDEDHVAVWGGADSSRDYVMPEVRAVGAMTASERAEAEGLIHLYEESATAMETDAMEEAVSFSSADLFDAAPSIINPSSIFDPAVDAGHFFDFSNDTHPEHPAVWTAPHGEPSHPELAYATQPARDEEALAQLITAHAATDAVDSSEVLRLLLVEGRRVQWEKALEEAEGRAPAAKAVVNVVQALTGAGVKVSGQDSGRVMGAVYEEPATTVEVDMALDATMKEALRLLELKAAMKATKAAALKRQPEEAATRPKPFRAKL
ncbi:hypothetical protein HK101_011656 [Irineochytrium annulatum]|nr:hypothetical protein HK101_011656 [Irineochytrium annulatum]